MLRIQKQIAKWATKQFPYQTPLSKMKHLEREIKELREEIVKSIMAPPSSNLPVELSDCGILLLEIADIYKIDLLKEMKAKMKINKSRKWGKPDEHGVSSHIKGIKE